MASSDAFRHIASLLRGEPALSRRRANFIMSKDKAERRLGLVATRWDYPPARGWCRRPLFMMRS
jgi:hypothetical protein